MAKRRRHKHPAYLYSTTAECPWCHVATVDLTTGMCPKCGTAVSGYKEKRFVMGRRSFWQRRRDERDQRGQNNQDGKAA